MDLLTLKKNLSKVISNYDNIITKVLKQNEKDAVKLNQFQMRAGKLRINDEWIGDLKSLPYAKRKIKKGGKAPYRKVDLYDTGEFQSEMYAEPNVNNHVGYLIFSSLSDTLQWLKGYTSYIFGTNDENTNELRDIIELQLINKFKDGLQL